MIRYDLTRGLMDMPARPDADRFVNIQGEAQIRGYRVLVTLKVRFRQPKLS